MSKTIFLSSVSNEFGRLRLRLAHFGQRTHKVHVRHQDHFANAGVVTLRMLEEEICKSDYVVHLIGLESGWVPSQQQVDDFLDRHPGFLTKFKDIAADARQGLISATQWEAWLGLYFDITEAGQVRRVFSYEIAEPLPEGSPQWVHSQRLAGDKPNSSHLAKHREIVELFRGTRHLDHLPKPLMMLSTSLFIQSELDASEAALKEAELIASRGSMNLFMADIHLHRARLFRDPGELAKATTLIRDIGYGRRYDELADAEVAINEPERFPEYLAQICRQEAEKHALEEATRQQVETERLVQEKLKRKSQAKTDRKERKRKNDKKKEADRKRKRNR